MFLTIKTNSKTQHFDHALVNIKWMINEWMNVYLDTAHITSSHGGLQFLVLSEIEHQLVKAPLAATTSSYLISLIYPTHA